MLIGFKILLLLACVLANLASLIRCLDSDTAFASLILTSKNSNISNLTFTKAGIYSLKKSNVIKQQMSGNLIYLDQINISKNNCVNKNTYEKSFNIALVELKDLNMIQYQIRSISCFDAGIFISNDESYEFKFDQNLTNLFILTVSNSTGKEILKYVSTSSRNVLITITDEDSSRKLTLTSLLFIIVGSLAIVVIICSMWALFYKIQKHRRIEDRELLAVGFI